MTRCFILLVAMMTSESLTKQLRMASKMEFLIELHVLAGVELALQALHTL